MNETSSSSQFNSSEKERSYEEGEPIMDSPTSTENEDVDEEDLTTTSNEDHETEALMERSALAAGANPMSPNAMAEAAYAAGVECRKRRDADRSTQSQRSEIHMDSANGGLDAGSSQTQGFESMQVSPDADAEAESDNLSFQNKRRRLSGTDLDALTSYAHRIEKSNEANDYEQKLEAIWKTMELDDDQDNGGSFTQGDLLEKAESSLEQTKQLVFTQLDSIIRSGLDAFHQKDDLHREVAELKELSETRGREIQRLKASEEDSRTQLSNLLQAVTASKASARDLSRSAHSEVLLRKEVSTLRSERDAALGECEESNKRAELLGEEVRLLKSRVTRLTKEKIKVERDSRAALSLARSMDSHATSDVDYYKRKVSDLNSHLHSRNTLISELKHQVEEYRRQIGHSASQQRYQSYSSSR